MIHLSTLPSGARFPFVRITFVFIAGLLAAHQLASSLHRVQLLFTILGSAYILIVAYFYRKYQPICIGILGLSSIFLAGYICFLQHMPQNNPYHLTHFAKDIEAYEGVVIESKINRRNAIIAIKRARIHGCWLPVDGKVKLHWPSGGFFSPTYGDVLLVKGSPKEVPEPLNEYVFNYKRFLAVSGIYHQHLVQENKLCVLAHKPPNILINTALQVRKYMAESLKKHITDPNAQGIALALVLGIREELDRELQATYAGVGVIHVLAVSGLHVGLLYAFILFLLHLLSLISGLRSSLLSRLVALSLFWAYAFITGLSPSVMRAVSMFSLLSIAGLMHRTYTLINVLAASAFLLLLYNPLLLFNVGFQLSYIAVLGIIYLYPLLYKYMHFSTKWKQRLWELTAISLAAQTATLPLVLYYFHWFPTYFLLANWVVVPTASIILSLSFLIVGLSFLPPVCTGFAWAITQLIVLINKFTQYLHKLPYSQFGPFFMPISAVFYLYALLVGLCAWIHYRKFRYLLLATCPTLMLGLTSISQWSKQQEQLIVYNLPGFSTIAFVQGSCAMLLGDKNIPQYKSHITPSLLDMGIRHVRQYTFESMDLQKPVPCRLWCGIKIVVWQGQKGFWVDNPCVVPPSLGKHLKLDFLIVGKNAVKDIAPWLAKFKVGLLIISLSNSPSLVQKLQKQARQAHIKCYVCTKQKTRVLQK